MFAAIFVAFVSIAVLFAAIFVAFVSIAVLFAAISDVFLDTALSIALIAPLNVVSFPAISPVNASATASEFADSIPNVLSTHCCFSAKIASASDWFTFWSNSERIAPPWANALSIASFAPLVIVSKIGAS